MNRWIKNTIILMVGLIIGSLTKLWPWKNFNNENISPTAWENINNTEHEIYLSIFLFLSAILLGLLISNISVRLSKRAHK